MPDHLLTVLAPMLTKRPQRRFNVFEVMHHGTHEKQLGLPPVELTPCL